MPNCEQINALPVQQEKIETPPPESILLLQHDIKLSHSHLDCLLPHILTLALSAYWVLSLAFRCVVRLLLCLKLGHADS